MAAFHRKCDMTQDFEESARKLLSLLNKLPSTPSITFRGFVDTSVTQARIVVSPALTATSHSIAIATNNLRTPHVGVVVGANGRDLTALMAGHRLSIFRRPPTCQVPTSASTPHRSSRGSRSRSTRRCA